MPIHPLHAVLNHIRDLVLRGDPLSDALLDDTLGRLDALVAESPGTRIEALAPAFDLALNDYIHAGLRGAGEEMASNRIRAGSLLLHASQALMSALPEPPAEARAILVVASEPEMRSCIGSVLGAEGFDVVTTGRSAAALEILRRPRLIELLVTAMDLADGDGLSLAIECRRHAPKLPVLFIARQARHELGAFANLLTTPFTPADLKSRVSGILASS